MSTDATKIQLETGAQNPLQENLLNAVRSFDSKLAVELITSSNVNVKMLDKFGNNLIFVLLKEYMCRKTIHGQVNETLKGKIAAILECILNTHKFTLEETYKSDELNPENKYFSAYSGYTPLMIACLIGDVKIVELLVNRGAKIDTHSLHADNPFKELCGACEISKESIQEFTAVMAAMVGGNIDTIKFLVDKGANLCKITPNQWYPFRFFYLKQIIFGPFDAKLFDKILALENILYVSTTDAALLDAELIRITQGHLRHSQTSEKSRVGAEFLFAIMQKRDLILATARDVISNPALATLFSLRDFKDTEVGVFLKSRTWELRNYLHVAVSVGNVNALIGGLKLLSLCTEEDQITILTARNSEGESPLDCAVNFKNSLIANEMIWILKDQIFKILYPFLSHVMTMKSFNKIPDDIFQCIYSFYFRAPHRAFAYQKSGKIVLKDIFNMTRQLFDKLSKNDSEKEIFERAEFIYKHFITGIQYSYESDKSSQKRAMTYFYFAAQKLFQPAMEKIALYYAQGLIAPQNIALVENILKKIVSLGGTPNPYVVNQISMLKELYQQKMEAKRQFENNVMAIHNPAHYVVSEENFYDKWCAFIESVNKRGDGPCRDTITFRSMQEWQKKPYFITKSDVYEGAYVLVIYFYRFEKSRTIEETIKSVQFEFMETLIRTEATTIELVAPLTDDNDLLIPYQSFNSLEELLKYNVSKQEVSNYYMEFVTKEQERIFKPFDVVSLQELMDSKKSIENYITFHWKEISEKFSQDDKPILTSQVNQVYQSGPIFEKIQTHQYYRRDLNKDLINKLMTEKNLLTVLQQVTSTNGGLNKESNWAELPFVIWPYSLNDGYFMWTALYFKYPLRVHRAKDIASQKMGVDIELCQVTQMFKVSLRGITPCEEFRGEIELHKKTYSNLDAFIRQMCNETHGAIQKERSKKGAENYILVSLSELRARNLSILGFINNGESHQFDFDPPVKPRITEEYLSPEEAELALAIKLSEELAREAAEKAKKKVPSNTAHDPSVEYKVVREITATNEVLPTSFEAQLALAIEESEALARQVEAKKAKEKVPSITTVDPLATLSMVRFTIAPMVPAWSKVNKPKSTDHASDSEKIQENLKTSDLTTDEVEWDENAQTNTHWDMNSTDTNNTEDATDNDKDKESIPSLKR